MSRLCATLVALVALCFSTQLHAAINVNGGNQKTVCSTYVTLTGDHSATYP